LEQPEAIATSPVSVRPSTPRIVVVGLVLSLLGFTLVPPLAIPGLIVSILGLRAAKRAGAEGIALAWVGIGCGVVGLVGLIFWTRLLLMYLDVFSQMTPAN